MNNNTLYFYQLEDKLLEINIHYRKTYKTSATKIFQKLLLNEMTTIKGRIDAIKQIFSYSYNVPIYINQKMIFFKIFGKDKIWVNGSNIESVKKRNEKAIIIFKNGYLLEIEKNYRTIKTMYDRIINILDYKNGLHL